MGIPVTQNPEAKSNLIFREEEILRTYICKADLAISKPQGIRLSFFNSFPVVPRRAVHCTGGCTAEVVRCSVKRKAVELGTVG